jgi:cobalt-zinc-cadmium efflux system membrane fusion protein
MGKVLAPRPQTAIVSHAFTGRVSKVQVKVGDWVEKGQELVTLESQEVGEARSDFYKAIADLELAKLNLAREERLLEQGIGIKKNYVAAEAAHKIAEANAEAAEKKLHVLGFTEEQVREIAETHQISPTITLFAPIAGRVVASEAVRGALVCESSEILTIIDTRVLWVDAAIYEKDLAKVRIGQQVEIVVPAYPDEVFLGKVSYIGDLVDEETRTITVRAEVANEDARLKPGMFANVRILLNGNQKTLVVPQAAVLQESDRQIVFLEEGDHFVRREIQTGDQDGDYLQVARGLGAGDIVVVQGNHQLRSELLGEALHAAHTH